MGSLYSSSYFSSIVEEVNFPTGKEFSIIFHILPPIESRFGVLSSSMLIKSINSKILRAFSLVILPSILKSYLAPSLSCTSIRIRFWFNLRSMRILH